MGKKYEAGRGGLFQFSESPMRRMGSRLADLARGWWYLAQMYPLCRFRSFCSQRVQCSEIPRRATWRCAPQHGPQPRWHGPRCTTTPMEVQSRRVGNTTWRASTAWPMLARHLLRPPSSFNPLIKWSHANKLVVTERWFRAAESALFYTKMWRSECTCPERAVPDLPGWLLGRLRWQHWAAAVLARLALFRPFPCSRPGFHAERGPRNHSHHPWAPLSRAGAT